MKLSKNSWHYKFNSFVDDDIRYSWNVPKDFCSYFWCTICNMVKVLGFSILVIFMLFAIVMSWKYFLIVVGIVAIGGLLLAFGGWSYIRLKNSDSFVGNAYKSFKDKTCHRIDWE
jgi:hypothetical protein